MVNEFIDFAASAVVTGIGAWILVRLTALILALIDEACWVYLRYEEAKRNASN